MEGLVVLTVLSVLAFGAAYALTAEGRSYKAIQRYTLAKLDDAQATFWESQGRFARDIDELHAVTGYEPDLEVRLTYQAAPETGKWRYTAEAVHDKRTQPCTLTVEPVHVGEAKKPGTIDC